MERKPTQPMELSDLAQVDNKPGETMLGSIVRTSGVGRGFQYSPRHPVDVKANNQIYEAYLQVPGTDQVVIVQGSHNVYECAKVASAYKASSEMNIPLEVIAGIGDIQPTLLRVLAVKLGSYMVGDLDSFECFQETRE